MSSIKNTSSNVPLPLPEEPFWFFCFLGILVLLPLPFGSNRPWASDLFGLLSALALIGFCWNLATRPTLWPAGAPVKTLITSSVLMALVVLWAFLQTQNWVPRGWHHPLWNDNSTFGSISVDPDRFPESLIRLLGYTSFFFLAFFWCRNSARAKLLVATLAWATVIYASYGLLMQATGLSMVLWFEKWAYKDAVTSTFINKNSFATYASLGLLCCLVLFFQGLKHKKRSPLPTSSRQLVVSWFEKLDRWDFLHLMMCLVVFGALFLSSSRAGLFSGFAGCFAFLLALAVNRHWSWKIWLPLLLTGIVFLAAFLSLENTFLSDSLDPSRLRSDAPSRLAGYVIALRAIESNPWLGFGLGSFESAFRLYRDASLPSWFQHAHNDYLEAALELGLPAFFALLTSVLLLVAQCLRGILKRHRHEVFPALACGATTVVGLHAFADFSLQIPAVTATYAALLGLGVAQSWSSRKSDSLY